MQVSKKEDLGAYFEFLRENAEEAQALLTDLLISVTTSPDFGDHILSRSGSIREAVARCSSKSFRWQGSQ